MADLTVTNLVKGYGLAMAVKDISFSVSDGEFVTLLGPSGCGKTTTLSAIAGLESPTSGAIRVGETTLFDSARGIDLPPEARNCGLVFQSYALWPHMSVEQNLAFPLRLRRVDNASQQKRISEALDLVEMGPYAKRFPHELSGGQQQRVALARTLVYEPTILLLDEPLSNLDAKLRDRARVWLKELQRRVKLTTIYVTHDQVEALALSDRVIVMNGGHIAQVGTPRDIYERPADPFVADFIGTMSFLNGEVARNGAALAVRFADGATVDASEVAQFEQGEQVTLAFRPEALRIVPVGEVAPDAPGTMMPAQVIGRDYLGARWQYLVRLAQSVVKVETEREVEAGDVMLWMPSNGVVAFRTQP